MNTNKKRDNGGVQVWCTVVFGLVLTLAFTLALTGRQNVVKNLQNPDSASTADVIVKHKNAPDDSKAAQIPQKGDHERLSQVEASVIALSGAQLNGVAEVPARRVNAL
jgi:hypothetical protein